MSKIKSISLLMFAMLAAYMPMVTFATNSSSQPKRVIEVRPKLKGDKQRIPSKNPEIIVLYYDGNELSASIIEEESENCTITISGDASASYYVSTTQLQDGIEIGSFDYGELTLTFDDGRTYIGEL